MIILTGTINTVKLQAVKKAFSKLGKAFFIQPPNFRIFAIPAKTSVSAMPLTLDEIQDGARQRAEYLLKNYSPTTDKYIALGMEGGVYQIGNQTVLQNWVYASDGTQSNFGASALISLPVLLSRELFINRRELAEVIDEYSGKTDVRSKEGAFGILSRNLITRRTAFETAIISAVIPLLNRAEYQSF